MNYDKLQEIVNQLSIPERSLKHEFFEKFFSQIDREDIDSYRVILPTSLVEPLGQYADQFTSNSWVFVSEYADKIVVVKDDLLTFKSILRNNIT